MIFGVDMESTNFGTTFNAKKMVEIKLDVFLN